MLRWALVETAWRAVRSTGRWRVIFENLSKRRGKKKAIVAIARRLLCVMFALMRSGQKYRLAADDAAADAATHGQDDGPAFVTDAEMRRRERDNITAALEHAGGKIHGDGGAAELLGIRPSTLASRMATMDIAKPKRAAAARKKR